jgi:hypothetical protein
MTSTVNSTGTSTGVVITPDSSGSLALQTAGTTAVTIDTSQNVGIGTTSPSVKLQVKATTVSADIFYALNSNNKGLNVNTNSSDNLQISHSNTNQNIDYWVSGTGVHTFSTNGSERMRITSGGAVCIGRTSQIFGSTGLCVETSSNSVNCVVTNSGQSALSAVNTAVNTGTSCSLVSFNVGISGGGSQIGTITYNGTNTLYNSTSDQRLKKNIVDSGSGLAKLSGVKIRAFDWIEHENHTDFGVVAQELVTVAPEAVSVGDDKEAIERIWAVDTSTLVPAMIKAIQELKAINDQQAETINALTARVVALESRGTV